MNFRNEIRLITLKDVQDFVNLVTTFNPEIKVVLEDDDGNRVNARSLLGTLYSMEWKHIYCSSSADIGGKILRWIV